MKKRGGRKYRSMFQNRMIVTLPKYTCSVSFVSMKNLVIIEIKQTVWLYRRYWTCVTISIRGTPWYRKNRKLTISITDSFSFLGFILFYFRSIESWESKNESVPAICINKSVKCKGSFVWRFWAITVFLVLFYVLFRLWGVPLFLRTKIWYRVSKICRHKQKHGFSQPPSTECSVYVYMHAFVTLSPFL